MLFSFLNYLRSLALIKFRVCAKTVDYQQSLLLLTADVCNSYTLQKHFYSVNTFKINRQNSCKTFLHQTLSVLRVTTWCHSEETRYSMPELACPLHEDRSRFDWIRSNVVIVFGSIQWQLFYSSVTALANCVTYSNAEGSRVELILGSVVHQ